MDIKLDENSKEFKDFETALEIVNRKIADINARATEALDSGNTDSLTLELYNLLEARDKVCKYDKETISNILSTENN